tara:strand:- start:202 stop:1251 length:1050 start_codon:yes stop_codon:yes gene_type:complete
MSDVVISIGGQEFEGWKSLEIIRSMEAMSGAFSVTSTDLSKPWLMGNLRAGTNVEIIVDGQPVLIGYVDKARPQYSARGREVSISGRDRIADLLDCAATVDGPYEFKSQILEAVIKSVLKPYSIPLTISAETGKKFERIAINPGETAYEFIERICRYRSVLPISDGIGGLHLVKPGNQNSGVSLVYGDNILSGSGEMDYRDLHSLYVFKSQGEAGAFTTAEESATPEGRAEDLKVGRYRPFVEVAEAQGFNQTLAERAEWQKRINRARATTITYDVQGFYSSEGQFWLPNTLVDVKDPELGVERTLLIKSVTMSRQESGTITQLDMTLPEAFDIPPVKEPSDDDAWGGI